MRDLAKAVGIEPASLYNHIKSKEEILSEICFRIAEEFFAAVNPIIDKDLEPDQKLVEAILAHVDVIARNLDASRVFFIEWKHMSDPLLSEFKSMRRVYEQKFKAILVEGKSKGTFEINDVRITAVALLSSLNAMYDIYRPTGKLTHNEIANQFAHILINGIKAK